MRDASLLRPVRLAAYSGGLSVPSARLRIHQLIRPLSERGVELKSFDARKSSFPPKAGRLARLGWASGELLERTFQVVQARRRVFDGSLVHREFLSTFPTLEPFVTRPIFFDVDDAIWLLRRGFAAHAIARRSSLIMAGNRFLAEHFSQFAPVHVIPTAVDTSYYSPATSRPDRLRIGWCGTSSGFRYLHLIEDAVRVLLRKRTDLEFAIMAERPPTLDLPPEQIRFVPWSQAEEAKFLSGLAIGIMPLEDGMWERGKCAYKMLASMASGVPVVVSPVGMNAELLAEDDIGIGARGTDEWFDALSMLLDEEQRRRRLGAAGRRLTEQSYSIEAIADRGAAAIHSVLS